MSDVRVAVTAEDETIVLEETKYGDFQVEVRTESAAFFVDEPFGPDGLAPGPTPYDLLSAAVGACRLMTMRIFAARHEFALEHIHRLHRHS